jgi:hypothetical protein
MLRSRFALLAALFAVPILVSAVMPAGARADDGWLEADQSGCKVWARNIGPGDTVIWNGECQDGYAQGRATYVFSVDGKWIWKGEADFHAGRREGQGSAESADGVKIEGTYRNGLLNGRVIEVDGKAGRYVGEYRYGERAGPGRYSYANGDWYEGEFKAGLPNGKGTYQGHNNIGSVTRYTGLWRAGCFKDGERTAAVMRSREECGFR